MFKKLLIIFSLLCLAVPAEAVLVPDAVTSNSVSFSTAGVVISFNTVVDSLLLINEDGADLAGSISSIEWRRFVLSTPTVDIDVDRISPRITISAINNTDTIDIQLANFQAEKLPFASSFIPTTAAALTRNAETLKYPTLGNRTANQEACVVKLAPEYPNNTAQAFKILDTDTKRRRFEFNSSSNDVWIYANETDSAGSLVNTLINDTWTANTEMTLGYNIQHASPFIAVFFDGVADGTNETADDFINPAWGDSFYLGSDRLGAQQFFGTIKSIIFYNRVLNPTEHLALHNLR